VPCRPFWNGLKGIPAIEEPLQEPEINLTALYYNSITPEVEQSEPEIDEIVENSPEIAAEQAPEKREDDRGQKYCTDFSECRYRGGR
jgi:hypothetical protein